jgi:C4-dicarboxylate-specific signal transduction histidine kinase
MRPVRIWDGSCQFEAGRDEAVCIVGFDGREGVQSTLPHEANALGSAAFDEQRDQGVAVVLNLTERKRAEAETRESERRYGEMQTHANRVATMGQLTASIAHEVNQPITAAVTNAEAAVNC